MHTPNDILFALPGYRGLTGYVWAILWLLLLLSVSHLILPFFASANKGSHIFKTVPDHISFKYDWPYHLIWIGIIPPTILLIYLFHGRTSLFIQDIFTNYEFSKVQHFVEQTFADYQSRLQNFRAFPYIPVISLVVTSGISLLIYRVNQSSYTKAGMTTWWLPNPGGKPALSTIFFHIWSAIIGATALVYVIHHVAVSTYVYHLLGHWDKQFILSMEKGELIDKFYLMVGYFASPVYVLLPGVILGSIIIGIRKYYLGAKFTDPVIIITLVLMTVGLFLLYLIPVLLTGVASKAGYATAQHPELQPGNLPIFPRDTLFYGAVVAPILAGIGSGIGVEVANKIIKNSGGTA